MTKEEKNFGNDKHSYFVLPTLAKKKSFMRLAPRKFVKFKISTFFPPKTKIFVEQFDSTNP
jgi:hypothetical protein